MRYLRGMAHALAACARVVRADSRRGTDADRRHAESLARDLAATLKEAYHGHGSEGRRWFEPVLTYAKGVLPRAGWAAYLAFADPELRCIGIESRAFLTERMSAPDYTATGEPEYAETLSRCRAWYRGASDLGIAVVDRCDGGVADALTEGGPIANQGGGEPSPSWSQWRSPAAWSRTVTPCRWRSAKACPGRLVGNPGIFPPTSVLRPLVYGRGGSSSGDERSRGAAAFCRFWDGLETENRGRAGATA